jgi:hypothetical protein
MTQSQSTARAVPAFRSVEEAAEFWDTHSTTEFEHHWEAADVEVAQPIGRSLFVTVELEEAAFARFRTVAKDLGVSADDLARRWLLERLAEDSKSSAAD